MADEPDKPGAPQGVTSSQLAALFDCTPRQVELYAKDGIVVRVGRGRYDAGTSTRNLIKHLRKQASLGGGSDPNADVVKANKERSEEQAALTRTKRMQLEGTLVAADTVKEMWSRMFRGIRQAVLGLPGAIAYEVPTLTPHDLATIKRIVADTLNDAAQGKHVAAGGGVGGGDDDAAEQSVSDREARGRGAGAAGAAAASLAG